MWWMPWQQEAMKDAGACDKLRGAGKHAMDFIWLTVKLANDGGDIFLTEFWFHWRVGGW
jgi:hypothetical protein